MEIPSTVPHVLEVPMAVVFAGAVVVVCAKLSVENAKAVITNECLKLFFSVFFMRFIFLLLLVAGHFCCWFFVDAKALSFFTVYFFKAQVALLLLFLVFSKVVSVMDRCIDVG